MTRAKQPPRIALPVVVLVVLFVAGGVWTAFQELTGDDAGGSGSGPANKVLERARSKALPSGPPIEIGGGPPAYTVVYEVRTPGLPVSRETIAVERPYRSRRSTATDLTVTDFARLSTAPARGAVTIASPPPAPVDPQPSLVVARAVDEGLLDRRERRTVAGQTCQVFRSLGSISSSTISAALPGRHTDICIRADGLVLEEWQVEEGVAVRQRVAVDISSEADVPSITGAPTLSAAQGGGSVLPVDATSRPVGRFFELDAPPPGFTRRGRYSVVPPQAGLADPQERRRAVASTADVYERGTEVLIVDRGNTLNLDRAFSPRPEGRPVPDLGPAFAGAEGELLLSWVGPEVRWGDEDGRFVRVYGNVPIDLVTATVRSLRATDGGTGLVFTGGSSDAAGS